MNSYLHKIDEFFDLHFSLYGLSINAKGEFETTMPPDRILNRCYLMYHEEFKIHQRAESAKPKAERNQAQKLPLDLFKMFFWEYVAQRGDEKLAKFKKSIAYDADAPDELSRLAQCFDGTDFQRAVVSHWMWTVKRSIFHNEAKFHPFMLIFVSSAQGIGKSTFTNKFVEPISPMVLKTSVEAIADSRIHPELARNYIVVCDELAKIERTDVNELKRVITMDDASVRELYKNTARTFKNQTSFIGSSNKKIIEAVYDSTGMRRFVEIEIFPGKSINFELLESIDMHAVWRNIDENLPHGFIGPIMGQLKQVQATYVEREIFEDFMIFYGIKPNATDIFVGSSALYETYEKWCFKNKYKPLDHKPFARKLTAANVTRRHSRKGNEYGINADSTIFDEISTC